MAKDPAPVAFLVVCQPGTTDTAAAAIRTALRCFGDVASVDPVTSTSDRTIAQQRAKAELRTDLAGILQDHADTTRRAAEHLQEQVDELTSPKAQPEVTVPPQRAKLADTGQQPERARRRTTA